MNDERTYQRERNRRRRIAARAEGVCIICTIRDARPNKSSCFECAKRRSAVRYARVLKVRR